MDKINLFHRPNIIGYSGDKIHRVLKTRLIPAGDSAACRKCINNFILVNIIMQGHRELCWVFFSP